MRRLTGWIVLAMAVLGLSACGSTIGDPCTTPSDCGNELCLNRDFTPGGYCSRQCVVGDKDSCPSDSTCVENGAAEGINACFRTCGKDSDCRTGYRCRRIRDVQDTVCVGEGI